MIKVKIVIGKKLSVVIKGHAGGEKGKDIICASASILAYTLAQNVKDGAGYCESHTLRLDEGNTEITCKPLPDFLGAMTGIYIAFIRGFQLLATNFPDEICVQGGLPKHKYKSRSL